MIVGTIERTDKGAIVLHCKPGLRHPLRGPGANAAKFRGDIGPLKPEYVGRRIVAMPGFRWTLEPRFRLYAWTPERKACRAQIRHFVAVAAERKAWALAVTPEWRKGASVMSLEGLREAETYSVRQLARQALEYGRLRAFMRGAYEGWPGDKPAHDLWQALANGTPARFYDSAAGEYVERVGGAAGKVA